MIGFRTEKVQEEYSKAAVALRFIVEALQETTGGGVLVFRVNAPTRFEQGVHSTGIAIDVQALNLSPEAQLVACIEVSQRFPVKGPHKPVCTLQMDPSNLPNGKRVDTPHIHIQIPFDWKADPRSFLEAYGFLEGMR